MREGIVFLDGKTETDERKKWAEQLILRTQDVVAVVNRLDVERTVSWDLNRRAEFEVGIDFDDSIVKAQEVIIKTLRAHPAVLADPEPAAIVNELGAATVNIRAQFWLDGRTYSIFKVRSALIRQVKRALQDAEISMPDAAREIIFPQGLPLRRADAAILSNLGAAPAEPRNTPEAARSAKAEAADTSKGEGDLKSEEAGLKRQASAGDLPEGGENLLSPSPPPSNQP